MKRIYNTKRSLPDQRDFHYHQAGEQMLKAMLLPRVVDLRPRDSAIFDQGQVGSCTGNAICGAVQYLELEEIRLKLPQGQDPQEFIQGHYDVCSRLFVYYCERVIEGDPDQDGGANIRTGCDVATKIGVCRAATWPYVESQLTVKPSDAAYAEAAQHKVHSYYALNGLTQMKQCLANGYPFVFGIAVYDSFESDAVAQTGVVPMPSMSEGMQGGHAVCCVGYDDAKQHIIVRNSWGTGWGDKGYFYLPYAYASDSNLTFDPFTLRRT